MAYAGTKSKDEVSPSKGNKAFFRVSHAHGEGRRQAGMAMAWHACMAMPAHAMVSPEMSVSRHHPAAARTSSNFVSLFLPLSVLR